MTNEHLMPLKPITLKKYIDAFQKNHILYCCNVRNMNHMTLQQVYRFTVFVVTKEGLASWLYQSFYWYDTNSDPFLCHATDITSQKCMRGVICFFLEKLYELISLLYGPHFWHFHLPPPPLK